jgi:uncharacterized protein (DUF2235 family)
MLEFAGIVPESLARRIAAESGSMVSNKDPAMPDRAPNASGTAARNIVIFSDGTGQDGGVHPEQRLSNVYKLYRAARVGSDNDIDPSEQVAFYDPGLGTDTSATGLTSLHRKVTKLLSSATGRGITTNIADCYEFIINHYRPGDRVYLIGFSRGAYTIRCIANVLMWCGIPTRDGTKELPRFRSRIREIADKAVIRVYEHGAGHPREKFEDERCELARRFREEFGSGTADEANAAPYFIGAFDTVASLGAKGPLQVVLEVLVAALVLAVATFIAALLRLVTHLGWFEALLISVGAVGLWELYSYLRTALKVMWPPLPGRWPRMHIAQWNGRNFDRLLSKDVRYARHAISIDENRDDFPRLKWGWGKDVIRPAEIEGETKPFIQLWFAGNHSDVGGSYPEVESRLSDITLQWMVQEAESLPHPLLLSGQSLHLYPSPAGLQHDEVAGMSDTIRGPTPVILRWLTKKWTWKVRYRDPVDDAPLHKSVPERFALPAVPKQGSDPKHSGST